MPSPTHNPLVASLIPCRINPSTGSIAALIFAVVGPALRLSPAADLAGVGRHPSGRWSATATSENDIMAEFVQQHGLSAFQRGRLETLARSARYPGRVRRQP
jgi:hypothetical protein